MSFLSFPFLVLFTGTAFLAWLVPLRIRWAVLLAAGLFFYGFSNPRNLIFLIGPALLVFLCALIMDRASSRSKKRVWLWIGLASGLVPLLVLKYGGFLAENFAKLWGREITGGVAWIWPLGISFYTFRLLSYSVDVYRAQCPVERHPGYFGLYVSFFPQLLAGPIDRARNLLPQFRSAVHFDGERIASGARLVFWGLFKKFVIADRLALYVNQVFQDPAGHSGLPLLFGAYFYALQIYCDFSGYSDIAIGLARILGFRSMENFRYPYSSRSLTDFWNRWHISLSTWLRDYLFLPVSYSILRRVRRDRLAQVRTESWAYVTGVLVTMTLGGLWHGAAWTFVLWGGLHGLYLVCGHIWKRGKRALRKRRPGLKIPQGPDWLKVLWTFHLVALAWVFFRAPTLGHALDYLGEIGWRLPAAGRVHLGITLLVALLFLGLEKIWKKGEEREGGIRLPLPVRAAAAAIFLCLLILFSVDQGNEFIYFQF